MFHKVLELCALLCIAGATTVTAGPTRFLFSFGDSYTQTAFNILGTKPTSENPIGNPTYPGNTFSGGANWIDYLVTTYNASSLLSYNFAYGGATVDSTIVPSFSPRIQSLVDQTTTFTTNLVPAPAYAPWKKETALFAIWIGINDIAFSFFCPDATAVLGKIMDSYFAQAQIMYDAGARNFLFLSIPPIQKTPDRLATPLSLNTLLASTVSTYNALLTTHIHTFATSNKDAKTTLFDTQPPFDLAIANPTAYGAPDATCQDLDGVGCLWWNGFHPGTKIQDLVAEGAAEVVGGPFFDKDARKGKAEAKQKENEKGKGGQSRQRR